MPTYEYLCSECKNAWEEIQKISEPPVEVCPKCGKSSAKRQISGGTFILKGGGWYADAYSSPKASASSGDGAGKSETKSETKSDSASTTTAESAPKADAPKAETKSESGTKPAA